MIGRNRTMPIYEYSCDDCGSALEQWQRFQDDPLRMCPSCGGSLRRVFHSVGIIFKGGGWYSTDSRPKVKSEASENESAPKAKSEASENGSAPKPDAAVAAV
jgi:putative FmdB family regulatory protein